MPCAICDHIDTHGWTGLSTGQGHCSDNPRLGIVGCHAEYRGRQVHMTCCHQTFGGETVERQFHRVKGRCVDPEYLRAIGLEARDGVWRVPMTEEAKDRVKRPGRDAEIAPS